MCQKNSQHFFIFYIGRRKWMNHELNGDLHTMDESSNTYSIWYLINITQYTSHVEIQIHCIYLPGNTPKNTTKLHTYCTRIVRCGLLVIFSSDTIAAAFVYMSLLYKKKQYEHQKHLWLNHHQSRSTVALNARPLACFYK